MDGRAKNNSNIAEEERFVHTLINSKNAIGFALEMKFPHQKPDERCRRKRNVHPAAKAQIVQQELNGKNQCIRRFVGPW